MKVLLKLYSTQERAADGSSIPMSSTEEYLNSDDYKLIIRDKLAIGGVTHKDRQLEAQYKGLVGCDDQVLINDNATHYFTRIFVKPNDPIVYGEIEIFDPDLFTGKRRENIINLIGLLKTGCKIPVSIVIHALWSPSNVAEKIIRIKGVDFTQNNSFPTAGVDKIMGDVKSAEDKNFSITDGSQLRSIVKSFSAVMVGNISEGSPRTFSLTEVMRKYGRTSLEYRGMRQKNFSFVSEDQLREVVKDLDKAESEKVTAKEEEKLVEEILKNYCDANGIAVDSVFDGVMTYLKGVKNISTDHKVEQYTKEIEKYFTENRVFSDLSSINDRLRFTQYPKITLMDRVIRNYKLYWEQSGKSMDDKKKLVFYQLAIQDLNFLLRFAQKQVRVGKSLVMIYALGNLNDQAIYDTADKLSKVYKDVIISEGILKFLPEKKYKAWMEASKNFYEAALAYITGDKVDLSLKLIDGLNR